MHPYLLPTPRSSSSARETRYRIPSFPMSLFSSQRYPLLFRRQRFGYMRAWQLFYIVCSELFASLSPTCAYVSPVPSCPPALDSTATNMVATADTPTIGVRAPFPKYSELSDEDVTSLFNNFKSKFDKTYVDEDEELMRMDIFRWNLKHIDMVRTRGEADHSLKVPPPLPARVPITNAPSNVLMNVPI